MALPPEYDTAIRDCDLYGELEPWQIWELYKGEKEEDDEQEEEEMFFFTRLKKKSTNGSRINRKVGLGNGAWQGEDAGKKVTCGGRMLGFKKRFRYENKGCEHDGGWIMHEYSLDSSLLGSHRANDHVLCRIRRNVNMGKSGLRSRKRRKPNHEEEKVNVDQEQTGFDYGDSELWSLAHMTSNFWNVDYNTSFD
uniref:NAC transcription factor 46 n=1 Tax=Litchi chinensis TaxID=151069 RepID=A0A8K1HZE4_LITCN|nr:NAC transcription factor 46 [Litchi chinensis]